MQIRKLHVKFGIWSQRAGHHQNILICILIRHAVCLHKLLTFLSFYGNGNNNKRKKGQPLQQRVGCGGMQCSFPMADANSTHLFVGNHFQQTAIKALQLIIQSTWNQSHKSLLVSNAVILFPFSLHFPFCLFYSFFLWLWCSRAWRIELSHTTSPSDHVT